MHAILSNDGGRVYACTSFCALQVMKLLIQRTTTAATTDNTNTTAASTAKTTTTTAEIISGDQTKSNRWRYNNMHGIKSGQEIVCGSISHSGICICRWQVKQFASLVR